MAFRFLLAVALVAAVCAVSCQGQGQGQGQQQQGMLSRLPGGQTAAGILASSVDGMSRYLAPDGPIQPGLTAIIGLPVRAGEQANRGITAISSSLNSGAQSLSRSAGQNGDVRMPGMQALESHMPASIAQLGQGMQSMIRSKNKFIMGQAEAGIGAANRMGQMMRSGLQVRSSGPSGMMMMGHGGMSSSLMEGPAQMMSSAQDFMQKSSSEVQKQLKQHLNGAMGRMGSMQGMGEGMRNQAQGIVRTVSSGLQGAMGQLQQTGETVMSQLQSNHAKNTQAMSGLMGSFQGSMGSMNSNMQKNMDGLVRHAQTTAHQLTSSLQSAAQAPIQMLSSLTSGLGSIMSGGKGGMGGGGGASSGGRY